VSERRPGDTGLGALIRAIAEALVRIGRGEVALARAEAARIAGDIGKGAAFVGIAAILALIGAGALAAAMVLGLIALGLPGWGAALAVAVGFVLVALGLLQQARHLLTARNLTPRRSIDSLRRDIATLRTVVKPDGTIAEPRDE